MSKCVVCKKELPEGAKMPVCEYHRVRAKEKGAAAVGALGAVALLIKTTAPKVVPVVKEKGPELVKAAKTVIRK